jgi:6-phosphogluconolactonase (cycloisomerase 2 family)
MTAFTLLVGGYTTVIYTLLFNSATSSLSVLSTSPAGTNPSWIATHPTNKSVVYATQEYAQGSVLSFSVGASGKLTQVSYPRY